MADLERQGFYSRTLEWLLEVMCLTVSQGHGFYKLPSIDWTETIPITTLIWFLEVKWIASLDSCLPCPMDSMLWPAGKDEYWALGILYLIHHRLSLVMTNHRSKEENLSTSSLPFLPSTISAYEHQFLEIPSACLVFALIKFCTVSKLSFLLTDHYQWWNPHLDLAQGFYRRVLDIDALCFCHQC